MFAVFVSGSGVDGFYSILAVSGFYRFARVRAAFAFLLPCAGFGCAPAVLRRVRLCAERKTVRFRLIFRLAETECMIYGIYAGLGACFA